MAPFDVEKALAGQRVITRDGSMTGYVTESLEPRNSWILLCKFMGGKLGIHFTVDGKFNLVGQHHFDLFMADENE